MKNTAVNKLNYTGIVTLSQYIGANKVKITQVHNTGGSSLFSFLASCLAGDFDIAKYSLPTKIRLLYRKVNRESDNFDYVPATQYIFLRTPPEPSASGGECKVRFSFTIPRDFLETRTLGSDSDEVLGLGLYANNTPENDTEVENFMAFCVLDSLDQSTLVNTFLIVDWDLIITNRAMIS